MTRPAVSVLVPFAGSRAEAQTMVAALAELRLRDEDEGVIADNSREGLLADVELPAGWRVVAARREGSPAHTRNAAALAASRDWFLFIDSDTKPPPDLLDRFFADPIADDVGIVGGGVRSDSAQDSLASRWADSRGMTAQETHVCHPFRPYFLSACLLVRRDIWHDLGGFYEGIFNGEDVDFCWRALDAGWRLELNARAAVVHAHRETVRGLAKQAAVRGASAAWVYRRWPQAARPKRPGPLLIARGALATPVLFLMGQGERGRLRAVDVATQIAEKWGGHLRHNRARERPPEPAAGTTVELWCDEFPLRGADATVERARELAAEGREVLVVAARRPRHPAPGVHDIRARYLEDETAFERLRALAAVALRRPSALRCAAQLRVLAPSVLRLSARAGVELHASTGTDAAAAAQRVARLAGRPCLVE